ncbi:MAG: S46 family peptidase [Bacteroidales bacterium]|nr:S46 family peptidase [Bacteroidales bacterium]
MHKVRTTLFSLLVIVSGSVFPDEGMWIPLYLGEINEKEMQEMGMRITAEDIYSENNTSLKDAIVIFGGGCTGALVSDQGLLLTNHHCGYGRIQAHSSIDHDYLTHGFWAMDQSEELPNPGLAVTFLVRMEDVTDQALEGVNLNMSEKERNSKIDENIIRIKESVEKDTHYKARIRPFFGGNQYFLFVNEIYPDVRLVGAPPSNIGKFGGDTDNWMWPRHTGDFSVFRIYADKDNKPAPYSENNVPFKPKKHFTVSLNGVEEGDFTFVFGYPGSTQSYIPSFSVDLKTRLNPIRIKIRDRKLDIISDAMDSDQEIRIQYSAKQAGIANGWKKYIGESRGIKRTNVIERKKEQEQTFNQWAQSSERNRKVYGSLLNEYEKNVKESEPYYISLAYLSEAGFGIETLRFALSFEELVTLCKDKESKDDDIRKSVERLQKSAEGHFKNYRKEVDKKIFIALIRTMVSDLSVSGISSGLSGMLEKHNNDVVALGNSLYEESIFSNKARTDAFLAGFKRGDRKKIEKDPAFILVSDFADYYYGFLRQKVNMYETKTDSMQRIFMKGLMEMERDKKFYPDANSTLRVAYGLVKPYQPADAVYYHYFTTLNGIMEKEDPDIYDYVVEGKLKELYLEKDFGRYADKDGTMHTCFIATNHTSGGNSGSPVLNADGHLIGLNFDRCWEGTMSDIIYDPALCRNITLDIRYCLFIIDKYAGAGHLVREMTFSNQ